MPTIAFWNLAKQMQLDLLVELLDTAGIEILAVCEHEFNPADLINAFRKRTKRVLNSLSFGIPSRIKFYSVLPEDLFRPISDEPYHAIREFRPKIGESWLLVGAHLPSKLHESDEDLATHARRLSDAIKEAEAQVGHDRTMVLGDFNMDPFEIGMVNGDGLHAVMDRRIASQRTRVIRGKEQPYFYNPMWKFMGDNAAQALGTYYLRPSTFIGYFWHTFDQVLVRPSLLAYFQERDLRVINAIGTTSLLVVNGAGIDASTFSDHLPIILNLET